MCHLAARIVTLLRDGCKFLVLFTTLGLTAQKTQLSLEEAYRLSRENYPAIRQKELIAQTAQLTIQNLSTSFLPQVTFNALASYQSQVTKVSVPLPGFKAPSQSKDQYKATAEVSQLIFDGGFTSSQINLQRLNSAVEESSVEVDLYGLKNRINQLYFNILYQDELLKQAGLLLNDIGLGINKVKSQVENGSVLRSNLQILQAQYLQTEQRSIDIQNTRKGLIDALAILVNEPLSKDIRLQIPVVQAEGDSLLNRPEIRLYEDQSRVIAIQDKLTTAKNLPKTSAFIQAGYGKPGLNLLSDQFDPFYIAGLRFNWSLGGLYNVKRDKKLISLSRQKVTLQKESFVLNTQAALKQQKAEINRYSDLLSSDEAIIDIRGKITTAAKAQLENAVINASDYLREINAEDQAKQLKATHLLQLVQARVTYQVMCGKL